jgi:hypothetical protein
MTDAQLRFLQDALGRICDALDSDARPISVLVGTISPAGEEMHYYVIEGRREVQRVLMLPDTPEADQARELLRAASVNMTPPDTPHDDRPPDVGHA